MRRRRFVQISALGCIASVGAACVGGGDAKSSSRPQLIAMLGPDRVRQIGARYRGMTPREASSASLRAAISDTRGRRVLPSWAGGASIDTQVADDFAAGRTVLVDGWVLSVTEARQCALYSLARG